MRKFTVFTYLRIIVFLIALIVFIFITVLTIGDYKRITGVNDCKIAVAININEYNIRSKYSDSEGELMYEHEISYDYKTKTGESRQDCILLYVDFEHYLTNQDFIIKYDKNYLKKVVEFQDYGLD